MIVLERNNNESSGDYALRVMIYNIVNIELPPGTAISENEIASSLKLSRTPVREALINLSKNSIVEIIPHKGSFISKINCQNIEEARFVRLALETAVLKLACIDIPPEYIIRLHGNLTEQRHSIQTNNYIKLLQLDNSFHRLIFEAVNKKWTYDIVSSQMIHFDRLRFLTLKTLKNDRTVEDHQNILSAIESHDKVFAETLIINHLARHNLNRDELIKLFPDYIE